MSKKDKEAFRLRIIAQRNMPAAQVKPYLLTFLEKLGKPALECEAKAITVARCYNRINNHFRNELKLPLNTRLSGDN